MNPGVERDVSEQGRAWLWRRGQHRARHGRAVFYMQATAPTPFLPWVGPSCPVHRRWPRARASAVPPSRPNPSLVAGWLRSDLSLDPCPPTTTRLTSSLVTYSLSSMPSSTPSFAQCPYTDSNGE